MAGIFEKVKPVLRGFDGTHYIFLFNSKEIAEKWLNRHGLDKYSLVELETGFISVKIALDDWKESPDW